MQEHRPSQTAVMVALMRALADSELTPVRGFHDPVAERLLPPPWPTVLKAFQAYVRRAPEALGHRLMRRLVILPLRTMAIDMELRRALAAGISQVVILGAGLDARAHRMPELSKATVYEVDHPATQAYKRRRAAGLLVQAGTMHYVSVDFERESLAERLAAAGHRRELPSVWIWEGVVSYLTDTAMRATLAGIAQSSATGSVLMVQYREPGSESGDLRSWNWIARRLGEPMIGLRKQEAVALEMERVGMPVVRDTHAASWAELFAGTSSVSDTLHLMRLAVGERR